MTSAANLYHSVINDLVASVRDNFLDESVDENVLQELKQLWMNKLDASKTIEPAPAPPPPVPSMAGTMEAKMAAAQANRQQQQLQQLHKQQQAAAAAAAQRHGAVANPHGSAVPPGAEAVASGAAQPPSAAASGGQLVITDPNRMVPVQITIPAQPNNPASQPRALTVQVPAHALQQSSPTSPMLQQVLTHAIQQALTLPESHAATYLQTQINQKFQLQ